MNLFKVGLLLSFIKLELIASVLSPDHVGIVANAANAIADYFSVNCISLFTNHKTTEVDDTIIQKLTKKMSKDFGKSTVSSNLSAQYNLSNRNLDQCYISLNIILNLSNSTVDNFKNFKSIDQYHSDKIQSGAWLIFTESMEDNYITHLFKGIYLPFDLEIIVAWIATESVHFKEIYQVVPTFPIKQKYFGNWSLKMGLISPQPPNLYFRRSDLEGLYLKVGYIDGIEPFIMNNSVTGYLIDVWNILEDVMNMSTIYKRFEMKRDKNANENSWLRVIKEAVDHKIDVGLADFVATSQRATWIDFSYPLFATNFQLYFRIFEDEVLPYTLLLPFENEIWLIVFIWLIINSVTIYWACIVTKKITNDKEICFSLPTSFFINFGELCGQGAPVTPKSSSCRILFLLTSIVSAILIPSYSASLIRYLTVKPSTVSFRDFQDFYEIGTHKLLVIDGSFEFHILNISINNLYEEEIFKRYIQNKGLPKSYNEAFELICSEEKTAIFTVTSSFLWEWNKDEKSYVKDDCFLRKMSQDAGKLMIGMIFPKNSIFRGLINHHLKKLHSRGIIQRLKMKYWIPYSNEKGKPWDSVSLQESTTVFQIFIGGTILSFFLILGERILYEKIFRLKTFKKRLLRRVRFY